MPNLTSVLLTRNKCVQLVFQYTVLLTIANRILPSSIVSIVACCGITYSTWGLCKQISDFSYTLSHINHFIYQGNQLNLTQEKYVRALNKTHYLHWGCLLVRLLVPPAAYRDNTAMLMYTPYYNTSNRITNFTKYSVEVFPTLWLINVRCLKGESLIVISSTGPRSVYLHAKWPYS